MTGLDVWIPGSLAIAHAPDEKRNRSSPRKRGPSAGFGLDYLLKGTEGQNRQSFVGTQYGFRFEPGAIRVGCCEYDGAAEILHRQRLFGVAEIETDDDTFTFLHPFKDKRIALSA